MSDRTMLPVADGRSVRRYAVSIARRHPRLLGGAIALHVLAAAAGLAAPRLLGDIVASFVAGTTTYHLDTLIRVLRAHPLRPLRQPGAR